MMLRLGRLFPRRKIRSDLLRLSFALLSVAFVIVLLSKGRNIGGQDEQIDGDDSYNQLASFNEKKHLKGLPLKQRNPSVIHQLSAKEVERYQALNPVIKGWGENGQPVTLKDDQEKLLAEQQFKKGAFNVYISDRLSPNRSLPDPRPAECSAVNYNYNKLGTCSVVIIFTDEIWSALIRTIWSTVNRTPPELLEEIILVDDASTKSELQQDLKAYCRSYFGDKVKLIRSDERIGLIRARILGAKASQGDVIVFLDSHCEVTNGWLEPLMATIAEDPSQVVCPVIDVISDKTLEYNYGSPYFFQIGSFTWSGHFTWIDLDEESLRKNPTKPVKSPTMAGGLFAVSRKYFFDIGAYDEAMEIWGGENLELSFRIWQCGGKLTIHPCSHVGHIFRDYHPYSFQGKDTHGINTLRTILVWMDPEYRRYFFMHRQDLIDKNAGDLSPRLDLKKKLNCKSFKWYLDNVFDHKKFIYDRDAQGWGTIRNRKSSLCLDTLNENEEKPYSLGVFQCSPRPPDQFTNQYLTLTLDGELRREENCASADEEKGIVTMDKCIIVDNVRKKTRISVLNEKKKQTWRHSKFGPIVNVGTGQCLSARGLKSMSKVKLVECDQYDAYQKWRFQSYGNVDFIT